MLNAQHDTMYNQMSKYSSPVQAKQVQVVPVQEFFLCLEGCQLLKPDPVSVL